MKRVLNILKYETVLAAAWVLALVTMFLVPPDGGYLDYIDWNTLMLLFALMAVMAGLQRLGVFRRLGEALLVRTATTRQLEAALVFLPFFTSMAVTNDVALITFVPFTLEVLRLADREERLIPVVALQTIAANLGSMTTPIGNPQNLYLYAHYDLSLGTFFRTMLPLTAAAAVLLGLCVCTGKSLPLTVPEFPLQPPPDRHRLTMYGGLFLLCLGAVADLIPAWALAALVLLLLLCVDRPVLGKVDYALLLTFVGFFLFVGNLGRVEVFRALFQRLLTGHEVLCAVLASQCLSNVPAALLLSGFTENGTALLVGTNLGGLGTLIASMASLISYKQVAGRYPALKRQYLATFTLCNLVFLVPLYFL